VHTRAARLARASVTASVSTLVTVVSHAVADGHAPHPSLLLVAFALSLLFCLALVGRTVSPSRLLLAVAVSQAMLHGVFAMSGSPPAASRPTGTGGMSGMVGMTHESGPGVPGMFGHSGAVPPADAAAHTASIDVGMLVGHLLAGLVTVLALTAGERAFWGLFDSLRLAGSALFRFVTVTEPAPAAPARRTSLVAAGHVFRPRLRERRMLALRHRGPPTLAA
jgi:hypothetical protein